MLCETGLQDPAQTRRNSKIAVLVAIFHAKIMLTQDNENQLGSIRKEGDVSLLHSFGILPSLEHLTISA